MIPSRLKTLGSPEGNPNVSSNLCCLGPREAGRLQQGLTTWATATRQRRAEQLEQPLPPTSTTTSITTSITTTTNHHNGIHSHNTNNDKILDPRDLNRLCIP